MWNLLKMPLIGWKYHLSTLKISQRSSKLVQDYRIHYLVEGIFFWVPRGVPSDWSQVPSGVPQSQVGVPSCTWGYPTTRWGRYPQPGQDPVPPPTPGTGVPQKGPGTSHWVPPPPPPEAMKHNITHWSPTVWSLMPSRIMVGLYGLLINKWSSRHARLGVCYSARLWEIFIFFYFFGKATLCTHITKRINSFQ